MASDTDTAKPDRPTHRGSRTPFLGGSGLGRMILGLNLLGLAVLVIGLLVLNEYRRGLVEARLDSLNIQGQLLADAIINGATSPEPTPSLDPTAAVDILELLAIPRAERARLYDSHGRLIADTDVIADKVLVRPLPPARRPDAPHFFWDEPDASARREAKAHVAEMSEVQRALAGKPVSQVRMSEAGDRVVSVSIPIQRVRQVLGVLTVEAGGVDDIVTAQRMAMAPFILVAIAVTLASSILLDRLVARPVLRLARAADRVRLSRARAISLPDLAARDDEVGDLTRSLESMTDALSARMDAIERFAADVSHEIKNPLTSIRSAVETLEISGDKPAARDRLLAVLKNDVRRLDRLITDISNASRLDAELSREAPRRIDLARLLGDIVSVYAASQRAGEPGVQLDLADGEYPVIGRESPFGQVVRNLIDNARSFSPPEGEVRVQLQRLQEGDRRLIRVVVDDNGPGVPSENLESIFERFYTARPKGSAFGGHSGLGLSIARQIVEAHHGRISAENRDGPDGSIAGARFIVTFSEAPAQA
jgi:two-component system, OmpR family, sensor histidine kinase ChvG